jgi:hypothetical protein
MSHFAKVVNGIVVNVITAEPDFFDSFIDNTPGEWIQTSYNTKGGQHLLGGTPLRYNYAGIGSHYDAEADAFYQPQPYPNWILDTETYTWISPIPMPDDGNRYEWSIDENNWVQQ